MSRCKFALEKPFEGGASCLKQTTARKKSRPLSRSLAFISIFCVLALLFTSLTPLSVFADDQVPANDVNPETPVDPKKPETPVDEPEKDSKKPEQAGQPADLNKVVVLGKPADLKDSKPQSADPKNQGTPDPQVDLKSIPENNDSAPKPTLVINKVQAGDAEISGKIETEGVLPTYKLHLEIVDRNDVEKYKTELIVDSTAPDNKMWTIALSTKEPLELVAGDKITITLNIPEMDWELSESAEVQSTKSGDSELEISNDNTQEAVRGTKIETPTIDKVFYDATTISGGNLHRGVLNGKQVRGTIHVTLKDKAGKVKAIVSVTPKSGKTWTVDLPSDVTVVEGDTVTAYQTFGEETSGVKTVNAEPSMASQTTLTMPIGEILIEQYVANIVSTDENTEALDLLKKANRDIADKIESVEFKITGEEPNKVASYTVTYTDKSKTGEIKAPGLTIKKVTETSRTPVIDSITVVDNEVKGKLPGPGPFDGIKVQLVLKVKKDKADQYCNEHKCTVDKDSSNPVGITLQNDGTFSYTLQARESLELDQIVGVSVKEPHKFVSCSTTTVKPAPVEKTEVRDPRKLTANDKKAIDAAIRKAYTVDGVSKLPNGTGDHDGVPAVIQFDDSGIVKIFSGNDVEVNKWDNDGKAIPEKNEDGSYKIKDGAEPKITILAKDLVKNIAPKSPTIAVDTNTGKVTITPPAYKEPGDDTDLLSYTVTYKDAGGSDKTVTATRDSDTNKWSGMGVDADTGVITLSVEDVELAGTVKAIAKDNGGLEGDTGKLDSPEASKTLETATVSYNGNGGTGVMDGKKLNKGSKYKILVNTFTAPENQEFETWKIGETEYSADAEITVKEDTSIKAIWKEKKKEKANDPSPVVPPVIGGINPRDIPPKYVVTPQGSMQPAPSASTPRVYKTLPRTGESNGLPLMASALLALLGGALILSRKRS